MQYQSFFLSNNPLLSLIKLCFIFYVIFTLSRVGLLLWQHQRIDSFTTLLSVFYGGVRIDTQSIGYLMLLPFLFAPLLLLNNSLGTIVKYGYRVYFTVFLVITVYMEAVSAPFINEYDLRPNRLFLEYLIYPKEIMDMLVSGYKLELTIGAVIIVTMSFYGYKWMGKFFCRNFHCPKLIAVVLCLLATMLSVLAIRSSFDHRPLNPSVVAFSQDALLNDLCLNSTYSVAFAAKQMSSEDDAFRYYPKMAEDLILKTIRADMTVATQDFVDTNSTLAKHYTSFKNQPKNIVILLLESHGSRYVKSLGGLDLSPNIDKLIAEGWSFDRIYATGTRSVRGIEAVTTGFAPTPARAVVKLGQSQNGFFTLAQLLASRGYATQFVYGGESHFDNMKSFFLGNGFNDIVDLPTFDKTEFVGSWGASDEDIYNQAHRGFERLAKEKQPFFSLVFSVSNHSPFDYPDGKIEPYNEPKESRENAVKYADYALGKFFEQARNSSYWNNTIFLVVADHDARVLGSDLVPIDYFKIPAIIVGKDIPHRIDHRLASQLDLPQTMLSLAGISSINPMIGHDLTREVPVEKQRALLQRDKNFAYLRADGKTVVFSPGEKIDCFDYDFKQNKLNPSSIDTTIIQTAQAYALFGSYAFKNRLYQDLTDFSLENQH